MAKKRFSAEQIVALLRQIEVATAQGKSISLAYWVSVVRTFGADPGVD